MPVVRGATSAYAQKYLRCERFVMTEHGVAATAGLGVAA
jgi:hypothetical protein